jgi:hypothetical protein
VAIKRTAYFTVHFVCGLQNELPCVFTHTWLDLDTLFGVSPLYLVVRSTVMVRTCHDSIFKCQSPLHNLALDSERYR